MDEDGLIFDFTPQDRYPHWRRALRQGRFAACSIACRVPSDTDPSNWLMNMQEGAGEMRAGGG